MGNKHNDVCYIVQVDARTGILLNRFEILAESVWDVHTNIFVSVTPDVEFSIGLSGMAGIYYRPTEVGLHLWPDADTSSEPLHVPGNFVNVVAGRGFVAGVCREESSSQSHDIFVYDWSDAGPVLIQTSTEQATGRIHSLSTIGTVVHSERHAPQSIDSNESFWGRIVLLISSFCGSACQRRTNIVCPRRDLQEASGTQAADEESLQQDGSSDAAQTFPDVSANEAEFALQSQVTLEGIEHDDDAVEIDPEEASAIAHEQWVSSRIGTIPLMHEANPLQIVVLSLTKHSQAIEDALLGTHIAGSLKEQGVDVKPEWARGAKVFVRDFHPEDVEELRVAFGIVTASVWDRTTLLCLQRMNKAYWPL